MQRAGAERVVPGKQRPAARRRTDGPRRKDAALAAARAARRREAQGTPAARLAFRHDDEMGRVREESLADSDEPLFFEPRPGHVVKASGDRRNEPLDRASIERAAPTRSGVTLADAVCPMAAFAVSRQRAVLMRASVTADRCSERCLPNEEVVTGSCFFEPPGVQGCRAPPEPPRHASRRTSTRRAAGSVVRRFTLSADPPAAIAREQRI